MCKVHTHKFVDLMAGRLRPLVEHMMGAAEFVALKDEIAQQMIENLPVAIRQVQAQVQVLAHHFCFFSKGGARQVLALGSRVSTRA